MVSISSPDNERYRAPLERMLAALDRGDDGAFDRELEALAPLRQENLFHEIGRLTRELHDALNAFHLDSRIDELARRDMPDARVRLNHIIDMTENAAHRSLALIEQAMPECDALRERTQALAAADAPAAQVRDFLAYCDALAGRWRANLSELLVAQDYQDLTGQIIRQVIALVERVEATLVELVRVSGVRFGVLRTDTVETVNDQDQVDELLSSLGF